MNTRCKHFEPVSVSLGSAACLWAVTLFAFRSTPVTLLHSAEPQSGTTSQFDDMNIVWTSTGSLLSNPAPSIPSVLAHESILITSRVANQGVCACVCVCVPELPNGMY